MDLVRYFAYGTTQKGFAHHRRFADLLGDPVGRVRTASAYAVVVPRRAACSNPGCPYLHRMAALVAGFEPVRVEGDLFRIPHAAVAVIDRLETGSADRPGPYVRESIAVVSLDGATSHAAQAYVAREPARWHTLVELGEADALATYPRDLATGEVPKDCCIRSPGHPPPHDVVDPLQAP
ncbi:MAG TPA: gamma-glutamylcyclotransferase family protein [Baekduia sp.]|nr:gamma-glutamylcyclotransferase family protein [Baekduia sp.]